MRKYNDLNSILHAGFLEIHAYMSRVCLDIDEHAEEGDELAADNFMKWIGGYVYIVETPQDLRQIPTCIESVLPKHEQYESIAGWASLAEVPFSYEVMEQLQDGTVMLWFSVNNTGGPSYFIPKGTVETHPNVLESLRLYNAGK